MPKSTVTLGVEAVEDELRLALVESGDRGTQVLATRVARRGEDLGRIVRSLPRRPSSAICAIPLEAGGIRILNLPPTSDENLERVVRLEAEAALPIEAEELAIAHHSLGMTEQSRIEVLLVAARQARVEEALRRFGGTAWLSARSTLAPIALLNVVQHIQPQSKAPCAVLKIEATGSELTILDRSRVLASQSIPMGVAAEPRVPEIAVPDEAPDELEAGSPIAALAAQVRYALQAVAYERGVQVERLWVSGAGATPHVLEQLAAGLDLPVEALSPDGPEQTPFTVAFGCALQAAGLAAVPVTLTATRVTVAREVEQRRQVRVSWGALVGAVTMAAVLVYAAGVLNLQRQVEIAEARVRELGTDLPKPEAEPRAIKAALKAVSEVGTPRVPVSRTLALLAEDLPEGTWLTEFTYNAETGVVIRGYSLSQTGPQEAQIALLRRDLFDEVTLDNRSEEVLEGKPVWSFQISGKLRPPERRLRLGVRR